MGFDLSKNDSFAKALYQYFTGAETSRNRQVLMHNRMGIRIEFDIDLCNLVLWTAPKAGESLSYKDRNFSCRDDNTSVFDVIHFLSLDPALFVGCDYGPYHSTIEYSDGTKVEILSLVDQPQILVRVNKGAIINFKSDKQDTPIAKQDDYFCVMHPDRGYEFRFSAELSGSAAQQSEKESAQSEQSKHPGQQEQPGQPSAQPEQSSFSHPVACDEGRSTYAQAKLGENQFVVITSSLMEEDEPKLPASDFDEVASINRAKSDAIGVYGTIGFDEDTVADAQRLAKLMQINKEILIAAQDASGAIQAALKRIYYLIWNRDGGMIWALSSYSGITWPLEKWTEFLLENPLEIDEAGWKGRTFAQMVNGKISKWQEDGTFYAVWAAFTHWTQTGDKKFTQEKYLSVLEESIDWMETYCLDKEMGLFGRYFYCETPLTGSRDNGWDNAVGKPGVPQITKYKDDVIVRSYDIYVNAIMHSVYMMLSAMERETMPEKASANFAKAQELDRKMAGMFAKDGLPLYGYLKTDDGRVVEAEPYGMDPCDYEWALAIAAFLRNPLEMMKYRSLLYTDLMGPRRGGFVAAYASVLSGMDTEFVDEQAIMDAVEYVAQQSYRAGDYLVMPNTIVEIIDVDDGNIFHDVRPQMFSISAMLAAVSNLAVKKLPFGLAVRASKLVNSLKAYQYQGLNIDFNITNALKGDAKADEVKEIKSSCAMEIGTSGQAYRHTMQLPIDDIKANADSSNTVAVNVTVDDKAVDNVLVYSSVELHSVDETSADTSISFRYKCYGYNHLLFRDLSRKITVSKVNHAEGSANVEITIQEANGYTLVSHDGIGEFILNIEK